MTVLDFIGQANKKYNYEEKFAALLSNTKHSVEHELKKDFVSVPKGCYIHLEKKASEYVLQNIKSSIETKNGIVSKITTFTDDTGKELTMANFLKHYRMDPRAIYKKDNFSRLCVNAGVMDEFNESLEKDITKAFSRLASIDSRRLIRFVIGLLEGIDNVDFNKMTDIEKRMLQMFYITVWMEVIDFASPEKAYANIGELATSFEA